MQQLRTRVIAICDCLKLVISDPAERSYCNFCRYSPPTVISSGEPYSSQKLKGGETLPQHMQVSTSLMSKCFTTLGDATRLNLVDHSSHAPERELLLAHVATILRDMPLLRPVIGSSFNEFPSPTASASRKAAAISPAADYVQPSAQSVSTQSMMGSIHYCFKASASIATFVNARLPNQCPSR